MAVQSVFTNLEAVELGFHGMFESSRLKATDCGKIYDTLVKDGVGGTAIAVDNGVAVKVGAFTGAGLQEMEATIADVGDAIAVIGTPAVVKDAFTRVQGEAYNFYNKEGKISKAYSIEEDPAEIFAVAKYQFTETRVPAVGDYVVVDGTGKWVAQQGEPDADTYGFIGKVHSLAVGTYYTMVRISVVKNTQVA